MNFSKEQSIIEAMLFSTGREVNVKEIMNVLEIGAEDIDKIVQNIKIKYNVPESGIEVISVENGYQMCTKKELYEYIAPLFDNRSKPSISSAALETLSIIAYNPKITRAEIEAIRGVSSDGTIYKLLEFDLIEEAGRMDAPGRPTMYKVTNNFMKMFGISCLDELPDLPKYKLDENEQIVLEDVVFTENEQNVEKKELNPNDRIINEAPMPEREGIEKNVTETNN